MPVDPHIEAVFSCRHRRNSDAATPAATPTPWMAARCIGTLGLGLLLVAAPRPAEAQEFGFYANSAVAAVPNDAGEVVPRFMGIASASRGPLSAGLFHLTVDSFSMSEVSATRAVYSGAVRVTTGPVLSYKHSGTTMFGPNFGVAWTGSRGRLAIPVARYLWTLDGKEGEWAIMAEGAAGPARTSVVFFGPAWELSLGSVLPRLGGVTPEVRLLGNRHGPGMEVRGTWTN